MENEKVLCISSNTDSSYTGVGTTDGFYIIPSKQADLTQIQRYGKRPLTIDSGGPVAKIALLGKTNIVAFVRADEDNKCGKEVFVYDLFKQEQISKIVHREPVLGLKLTKHQ